MVGASEIEGRGLRATDPIPTGAIVVRLAGRLVDSAELEALIARAEADPTAPYVDSVTIDEDVHLVLPHGSAVHFANHSCDPTLWVVGPYELAARRDLEPGGEATIDYGTLSGAEDFTMACRCGSSLCRGQVTSEDWRRSELKDRYGRHWVPALRARIASA